MSSFSSDSNRRPEPEGLKVYLQPRVVGMLFLGFSAVSYTYLTLPTSHSV